MEITFLINTIKMEQPNSMAMKSKNFLKAIKYLQQYYFLKANTKLASPLAKSYMSTNM